MGLVDSFAAAVLVERHLFTLIDTDPDNAERFSRFPEDGTFLAHEASVVIASDLEDQRARVTVELWDSEPDTPDTDAFRSMGESVSVTFESERIKLLSLMGDSSGEYELDATGPGPYCVRVWVSSPEEDPDETLEAYRFFERFLIQLWH
ncbi:hypothetical protein OOK58_01830 [Streptomyces sp. NBC_01728]|uniref:hypothetical protein n=2 Tax=unclassified Streptomyces TaxID=2593676 RepID=UPI0022525DDC|nr:MULTISPECIES: hypothetical protein [unclassified Streptomyces]MCX4461435.1 hypothetical protein [Streptomyces sp. NBC_01719]MCX4490343.1 hypothetical protein [Streptomyces sp. NBC_01728]